MTFLDKGGNVRDGGRSDNALRQVRAKREAEEAGMWCYTGFICAALIR